jgi:mannosyl-3-phosphoglycerate phosphatase
MTGFRDADLRHEAELAVLVLGMDYARIRDFLAGIRNEIDLVGFGDLTVEEVADLTGLTPEQAAMAKNREFSEPFLLSSEDSLPVLQSLAAEKGMKVATGGRFHHLIGAEQDKGEAVKRVREALERQEGKKRLAIGLGDSENDLSMLMEVDVPVIIPHPVRGLLHWDSPRRVCATQPGSRGWNEVMERLLDGFTTEHP